MVDRLLNSLAAGDKMLLLMDVLVALVTCDDDDCGVGGVVVLFRALCLGVDDGGGGCGGKVVAESDLRLDRALGDMN